MNITVGTKSSSTPTLANSESLTTLGQVKDFDLLPSGITSEVAKFGIERNACLLPRFDGLAAVILDWCVILILYNTEDAIARTGDFRLVNFLHRQYKIPRVCPVCFNFSYKSSTGDFVDGFTIFHYSYSLSCLVCNEHDYRAIRVHLEFTGGRLSGGGFLIWSGIPASVGNRVSALIGIIRNRRG